MTDENQFIGITDSQVLGYGESDTSGAWLKFRIHTEDLELFRGQKGTTAELYIRLKDPDGNIINAKTGAVIIEAGEEQQEQVQEPAKLLKGVHGEFWRERVLNGVFHNVKILAALGKDERFQDHVRDQKCLISGRYDDTTRRRNVFAHVLRADAPPRGGTGEGSNKPAFSGVALQQQYHELQHSDGWLAVHKLWCKAKEKPVTCTTEKEASDWIMRVVNKHRLDWGRKQLMRWFDVDSLSKIDPDDWVVWYEANVGVN